MANSNLHQEALSKKQKEVLPKLKFLKEKGFYLAGGTALALQLGHRTSMDFDFYKEKEFNSKILSKNINKVFPRNKELFSSKNTLRISVNKLEMSFFYYPYSLIRPLISNEVNLASKQDIAAMKLTAIADRGTRRDFIDLYFLVEEFGAINLFKFLKEKYPRYNEYHPWIGLTYFKNADQEPQSERYQVLKEAPSWEDMKKYFLKASNELKKDYFKI